MDRKQIISHVFPLDQAKQAFDMQCDVDKSVKVMIKPYCLSNIYIADTGKEINERIKALGIDPADVAPFFLPRRAMPLLRS